MRSLLFCAVGQYEIGSNHRQALKQNCAGGGVVEVGHPQHLGVEEPGDLREQILEPGEQRRVVEGPFRSAFKVPLADGQTVRDGQPVAVHLKVGRAAARETQLIQARNSQLPSHHLVGRWKFSKAKQNKFSKDQKYSLCRHEKQLYAAENKVDQPDHVVRGFWRRLRALLAAHSLSQGQPFAEIRVCCVGNLSIYVYTSSKQRNRQHM